MQERVACLCGCRTLLRWYELTVLFIRSGFCTALIQFRERSLKLLPGTNTQSLMKRTRSIVRSIILR